jgi:hypothetical protein
MSYLTYLDYGYTALSFLFAAHAAALVIVNATTTPKDDAILAKAYKVIEFVAGLVHYKAKT